MSFGQGLLLGAALASVMAGLPAQASGLPDCAGAVEVSNLQVLRAEKNGVLVLNDGRAVVAEGLRLPNAAQDRAPGFIGDQAVAELNDLVRGRMVTLTVHIPKEDRYGRIRTQVFFPEDDKEPWLQTAMLRRGLARVAIAPDRTECASELYAAEGEARAKRYGIWASAVYAVRNPGNVGRDIGTFQIVEGKVLNADVKEGRAYLNFGADWRTDFTVTIAPQDMKAFRAANIDPRDYVGKTIRVRGMVQSLNGPEIEIAIPQDVEVLQPPAH